MSDVIARMSGGELIGFCAVVGGVFIVASAIVGSVWMIVRLAEFRVRRAELEAGLKQEMLNRGLPVDEIERVLAAGQKKTPSSSADNAPLPHAAERSGCS